LEDRGRRRDLIKLDEIAMLAYTCMQGVKGLYRGKVLALQIGIGKRGHPKVDERLLEPSATQSTRANGHLGHLP
jgi:hypothetical protein